MKIPLIYPKIPTAPEYILKNAIAFEKIDGTNIHWDWQEDKFVSFGTRRDSFLLDGECKEFDSAHPELANISYNSQYFLQQLEFLLTDSKIKTATIFTEYAGPNSFAGQHVEKENKSCTVIDAVFDQQLLWPEEFITTFKNLPIPKIIFKGKYTGQLELDVYNSKYDINEGVVVKGVIKNKVYMHKIKTKAYLEKLKNKLPDEYNSYMLEL